MAAQYDMDYRPAGDPDPACLTGQGDITEVTAKVCRTNPKGWADTRDGIDNIDPLNGGRILLLVEFYHGAVEFYHHF